MKRLYTIELNGCDDYTIFDMELSEEELSLIKRVAEISEKTSTYGCMPVLTIEVKDGGPNE